MRLCDEYLARKGISVDYAPHVKRGFAYFRGGDRLLSIEWSDPGAHPGYYEFSECVLEKRCRVLSSRRVEWDEYEASLVSWRRAEEVVLERALVFDLTWRYFMRRHESLLMSIFPLAQLHATVDPLNTSRVLGCTHVLEALAERSPEASDFWHSRALDILSLYCHWIGRL